MKELARLRWVLLGFLIVSGLVLSVIAVLLLGQGLGALALNLGTELIGAVAIYFVFQLIIGRRERREAAKKAVENRKAELIFQMGSDVRDIAVPAADELRRQGWLTDDSLRGAVLWGANLEGANLERAYLGRATLMGANLQGAYLSDTNLEGADLTGANLQGTTLFDAILREALLMMASLQGAKLSGASLQGANLGNANLKGAGVTVEELAEAKWLAGATLPDGTKLSIDNWKSEFEEWRARQEKGEDDE